MTRAEDLPGLPELWSETTGVPDVTVAMLDGAVDICHPGLRGAKLQLADPLGRAQVDDPFVRGHGTAVAGLLFGNHAGTLKGVAPGCRGLLIPIYRVVNRRMSCSQSDLAIGIREAVRLGADVINVSGGELTPGGIATRELNDAVGYCAQKGRLLVAAAGNDGCIDCLHVPGAIPSVLVVGATEPDGHPLPQSNWGRAYQFQGIVAPGRDVLVAAPGGGYALGSGTSLATPLVAGVAALLASLQRKRGRRVDMAVVRRILLAAATGCAEKPTDQCDRLLFGRLNIARAHFYLSRNLKGSSMNDNPEPVVEAASANPALVNPAELKPAEREPAATAPLALAPAAVGTLGACVTPSIIPSDCGCGGNGGAGRYVYAIGDRIGYDFGTPVRLASLQANADPEYPYTISQPTGLLRYLLGSRQLGAPFNGNLHDARSIHWILYQENCPLYAVQPLGDFSETIYKALITFLIETASFGFYMDGDKQGQPIPFTDVDLDIRYDCLEEYFNCFGGQQDPLERGTSRPPIPSLETILKEEQQLIRRFQYGEFQRSNAVEASDDAGARTEEEEARDDALLFLTETPSRAAKVAIAGTLSNKRVTLINGQQVEVIHPDLRGMSCWNTARLLRVALKTFKGLAGVAEADAWGFVARVTSRLYELGRNDGKAPQDRAMNWASTVFLQQVRPLLLSRIFRDSLGGLNTAAVNDVQVRPAACQESGGEYDVELSLFSIDNTLRGLTVLASKVDVSDVVPVTLSQTRVFNKRQ